MQKQFIAICGLSSNSKEKKVATPTKDIETGVTLFVTPKLVDVFINNKEQQQTGFEANCWLRLAKRGDSWVQLAGIRLPSWQYKKIVGEL